MERLNISRVVCLSKSASLSSVCWTDC